MAIALTSETIINEQLALEPLGEPGERAEILGLSSAGPIVLDSLSAIVQSRERYYLAIKRADAGLAAAEALFANFGKT